MRRCLALLVSIVLLALVVAATAEALCLQIGDIVIEAEGGFSPQALPRHENAPITLHGGGKLSTASGELPPILRELTILFDRHGTVETTGLERCTMTKLAATDTATARKSCPNAIVGEGSGSAVVKFPEQAPIHASSPITLFNGPPKCGPHSRLLDAQRLATPPHARTRREAVATERDLQLQLARGSESRSTYGGGHAAFMKDLRSIGPRSRSDGLRGPVDRPGATAQATAHASSVECDPTVLAHAYLSVPAPITYIVPVVIETIHQGIYGYRTKATLPPIAGGYGVPISGHLKIGKKWVYKGSHYSYVNARCETGKLQAKGEFTFTDGTRLEGTFIKPCKVRG